MRIWIAAFICSLSIVLLAVASPATAQEAVASVETVGDIDLSNPGQVRAVISRVSTQDAQQAVGKYLQGTIQVIQQGGQPAIRIQWRTMGNTPADGAAAVPGLTSVNTVGSQPTLSAGSRMIVSGSSAALVRAAGQLGGEETAESSEESDDSGSSGSSRDSSGLETSSIGGGNEAQENQLANPTPLQLSDGTVETVTVATDAYGTTTDGCDPVLSEDGTEVIIMEAPTKNGEVTGACVESLDTVAVQSSYVGCDYEVDEANLVAYAMKRSYYTYGANTTYIDNECVADEDADFEIAEIVGECPIVASISDGVAVQHTKLQFLGRRNEVNEVADCAAREGQTFPIVMDENQCSMRDDFDASVTWARARPMFRTPDNRLQAAGECVDTETFYVHEKDFDVCDAFADIEAGKLYAQYRIRINVIGADEYRTAVCQPDTTAISDLSETGAGCESFHFEYDGYSHGATRIIRTDNSETVRDCAEAAIRYDHQREAQGWERDDANLQAYPREALYINLPSPAGKTYIEQAVRREDAEPVAYTRVRSYLRNTSVEYLEDSCIAFQNRDSMEVYERPDGTEVEHNAGATTALNIGDSCYSQNSPWVYNQNASSTSRSSSRNCDCWWNYDHENSRDVWYCDKYSYYRHGKYDATHSRIRPDGVTISTASSQKTWSSCTSGCNGVGHCSTNPTAVIGNTWYAEEGWQ